MVAFQVAGRYLVVRKVTWTSALSLCEVEVEGGIYPELKINVTGQNLPPEVDLAAVNDDDITSCVSLDQHSWLSDQIIQLGRAVLPFQAAKFQIYGTNINFLWQR